MTRARIAHSLFIITSVVAVSSLGGCLLGDSTDQPGPGGSNAGGPGGTGGTTASGGMATAGTATAGTATATAGTATAGTATGGTATGGTATGGTATGGTATGGTATGGSAGSPAGGSGSGGSSPGGPMSAGCGKAPTIAAGMYNNGNPIAITAAGKQRRYILSVPTDYDNKKPYRLIIAWHQLDGNDKQMYQQNYYWIKAIAEAASSTIFVAPNGEKNGAPCTGTGIAEGGCGWPDSNGTNVVLGDDVVAQVEANFCIDKNKIFANGWSYGGSMSFRTACSRPLGGATGTFGVRAVAIYNGAETLSSGGCKPAKPVALYVSHGTNDNVLQYSGGISMANTYAKLNGCTWMEPAKASGNHICTNVMGCPSGYPVEFCSFVGQHTPDPPREGGARWQPAEVWKMFSSF